MLLDMLPQKKIQRLKYLTDTVHAKSQEIFYAKRAAIERGDQELLHAVGEGKDIMSILCEWTRLLQHRSFSKLSIDF